MPDNPQAQATVKRLLEAEQQAKTLREAAEKHAREIVETAHAEAQRRIDQAREQAELERQRRLEQAKAQAKAESSERLEAVRNDILALQTRARQGFEGAVQYVIAWVSGERD